MRSLLPVRILVCALLVAFIPATSPAEDDPPVRSLRLGWFVDASRSPGAVRASTDVAAWIQVAWAQVESRPGEYDWTRVDTLLDRVQSAERPVAIALGGDHPHYLPEGGPPTGDAASGALDAWVAFVRAAVRRYGEPDRVFQVGFEALDGGEVRSDLAALAFKQAALAVRAEAEAIGTRYLVAQPTVPAAATEVQRRLWERDVAAYVDVVPLRIDSAASLEEQLSGLRTVLQERVRYPPAPDIWVLVSGGSGWQPAEAAIRALHSGASTALIGIPGRGDRASQVAAWVERFDHRLSRGIEPAPSAALSVVGKDGEAGGRQVLGRFFDAQEFETLVVVSPPGSGRDGKDSLAIEASIVRNLRFLEATAIDGSARRLPATAPSGSSCPTTAVRCSCCFSRECRAPPAICRPSSWRSSRPAGSLRPRSWRDTRRSSGSRTTATSD